MTTLMLMIANNLYPDILGLRPKLASLVPEIAVVLDKILQKTPETRYQSSVELANDLRRCLKIIKK